MLKCLICGFESENLSFHIVKIHNMKIKEYKTTYDVKYVQSDRLREIHKLNINYNNPTKNKNHSKESIIKMKNNRTGKGLYVTGKYLRTPEIREKISNGVITAHLRGDFDKVKLGIGSFIFSKKANKTIFVRSTWEADLVKILDMHPRINSVIYEPFCIPYIFNNIKHNYIPDFLVTYDDCIESIWEVKRDDWISNDDKTKAKLLALSDFCFQKNINMFVIDSIQLKKLKKYINSYVKNNLSFKLS